MGYLTRLLALLLLLLLLVGSFECAQGEPVKEVAASEIVKQIKKGEPVLYRYAIIKGELSLKSALVSSPTKFDGCKFDKNVIFSESTIQKNISFINTEFNGVVDLSNSEFNGYTSFANSTFKRLNLRKSTFKDNVNFADSNFNGDAEFIYSTFDGFTDFRRSIFNNTAHFRGSKFRNETIGYGVVYFIESYFNGFADFNGSEFSGRVYFADSTFDKEADFGSCTFNGSAGFKNSTFSEVANFTGSSFHNATSFEKSLFYDIADFSGSDFNEKAKFNDAQFSRDANFEGSTFQGHADFKNAWFSEGSSFLGEGANFHDILDLTGSNINDIYIRWYNVKALAYDYKIYKTLLDNYKKWSLYADYNDCYFNFRLELQRRQPCGTGKFLDFLQRIFYGYGTKPALPIIWSFIIMMISASFYYVTNGIQKSNSKKTSIIYAPGYQRQSRSLADKISDILSQKKDITMGEAFLFSATYFTSGASSLISSQLTEFYPVGKSRYIAVLERLLGWIFFAFFLTALGNSIM